MKTPQEAKERIHKMKTALVLISWPLTELRKSVTQSRQKKQELDKATLDELKKLEPLHKLLEKERKRIADLY